jgi:hypothetical protein
MRRYFMPGIIEEVISRGQEALGVEQQMSCIVAQKTEHPREMANMEQADPERTRKQTRIEDGNIIIETYTEGGELVKITPPGYLPFAKTA